MKILSVVDYYLPGYKSGGPLKSIANIIDHLQGQFEFYVLTRDRDLGDREGYEGIIPDCWIKKENYYVNYLSPASQHLAGISRAIKTLSFDLIYLNSFFSSLTIRVLMLRRLGLVPKVPFALAPRGEFSPGTFELKKHKKTPYLRIARMIGLYDGLSWQASSTYEKQDIHRHFRDAVVYVAPDLPPKLGEQSFDAEGMTPGSIPLKKPGQLRLVFLSRIARKKNLDYALKLLSGLSGEITFDIVGPLEDVPYWEQCLALIKRLPENISCSYLEGISPEAVMEKLRNYHFLLLPTSGENFGHVILEALVAGLPVIISDQTPWKGLARRKAGWDIPLGNSEEFIAVLDRCVKMTQDEYQDYSRNARSLGISVTNEEQTVEANRTFFLSAARVQ